MLTYRDITPQTLASLERVEHDVRSLYSVPKGQIVMVTQDLTRLLGGPRKMTTILFWMDVDTRHKVRVFKPATEVRKEDLPPPWLRSALLDDLLADCC